MGEKQELILLLILGIGVLRLYVYIFIHNITLQYQCDTPKKNNLIPNWSVTKTRHRWKGEGLPNKGSHHSAYMVSQEKMLEEFGQ